MKLLASIRIALRALRVNRMRSALTMLGIIIGVAAVIAMVAVGSGAPARAKRSEVASRLYEAVRKAGGKRIEEFDSKGILP